MPFVIPQWNNIKTHIEKLTANEKNPERVALINLLKIVTQKTFCENHKKVIVALAMLVIDFLPRDIIAKTVTLFWSQYPFGSDLKKSLYKILGVSSRKEIPRDIKYICFSQLEKFVKHYISDSDITFFKNKEEFLNKIILKKNSVENLAQDKYALSLKEPSPEELYESFKNLPDKFILKMQSTSYRQDYVDIARHIHCRYDSKEDNATTIFYNDAQVPLSHNLKFGFLLCTAHLTEYEWTQLILTDPWYELVKQAIHIEHSQQINASKKYFYFNLVSDFIFNNIPKYRSLALTIHNEANSLLPMVEHELDPHPAIAKLRDKTIMATNYSLKFGVIAVSAATFEMVMTHRMAWNATGIFIRLARSTAPARLAQLTAIAATVFPDAAMSAINVPLRKICSLIADNTGNTVYFFLSMTADLVDKFQTKVKEIDPLENEEWVREVRGENNAELEGEYNTVLMNEGQEINLSFR